MGSLNKDSYIKMINENIDSLEKYMPEHSLEKDHIVQVLNWSVKEIYDVSEKTCTWKKADYGSFGIPSYEYKTTCGKNLDCDNTTKMNYCPNCGGRLL